MSGLGLQLVPPAKVNFIEDTQVLPDGSQNLLKNDKDQHKSDSIGNYIQGNLFTYYHNARRNEQENICLDCERAYNNKYNLAEQAILAKRKTESGDSTVWVPYTRTKVNIAVAKTYEKMLNTSDHPWSIMPNEVSQQDIEKNQQMVMKAMTIGALQDDPQTALDKLKQLNETEALEKCESMESEIIEQMNQGDAHTSIAKTVLQQHYLGTGIAKFEIAVNKDEQWVEGPEGWKLETTEKPFPTTRFISWFNIFFDPYATVKNNMIERHVVLHSTLKGYKESQGFKEDIIDEIIRNNPDGNHIDLDYETTIRGINDQDQNTQSATGYFDVLEAWVDLPGSKLIEYGYTDGIEETQSYSVNCWVCGNMTIKLIMNPHTPQKVPYFVVPYEENTSTINGTGVSENLFGVQEVINSVTRATIDNAAFSHGPITEVNVDLLKSGTTPPKAIKPRSVHLREGGDPKEPLLRFYQPTENSGVLHNVYNMFSQIGEDVTGIASSTEESLPAANSPNMGISMTLSQKNILQRTVVGNIDKYLYKPLIEMYYNFNMKWNDRNDLKTPAKVTANGVTSIIAKEMRTQQLHAFAALTNNPEDKAIVKRKKVLEKLATSLDHDGEELIYSENESKELQQANGQAQQQAAQAEQQSIIGQIEAENAGEMEQERLKGTLAMKKQRLVEQSKMMQILAKEQGDITAQEMDYVRQVRMMDQQQNNSNQTAILNNNMAQQQPQQGQQQ